MSALQIRLLGEFKIQYGDEVLPGFQRPRLQAFLAYLLLKRGEDLSRQQLAYLFWPDSTEKQARTNIRNLLHQLRRSLPASDRFLHVTRTDIQWLVDSPCWLDVAAFEAVLEEAKEYPYARQEAIDNAIAIYRGELLPNLYDDWVLTAREEYHQLFINTLVSFVTGLEVSGEIKSAIAYARRLLKLDPIREETYRTLMRLHIEEGDRASALQTYHVCETTMDRELGVKPSQITTQSYRRILRAEPIQTTSSVSAAAIPLIGRQNDWQALSRVWRRAQRGYPHLVLLNGEAGVGKSRLASELIEKAHRQGIGTANARAYKSEGAPPYAAVVDLFQNELLREAVQALDPLWVEELSRLMPEWSREMQTQMDDGAKSGPTGLQRLRLFEAMARACIGKRTPIVIHIDDIHWCDKETLAWLQYLLRFDTDSQLLILVTARPEDIAQHEALGNFIRSLQRDNLITEIVVKPLDRESTGLLAAQVAGKPLDVDTINTVFAETEGNPLFVIEMVRMGSQTGDWSLQFGERTLAPTASLPPRLQAVLETRLVQLSPLARDLAGLASVFGRQFSLSLLIETCAHDEETVIQGIDELWQRRIVQEVGFENYYFTHGKLRAVAYASLSRARCQTSHQRIAEILITKNGSNPQYASQIARHLFASGARDKAVQYDLIAGDNARIIQVYQESIDHYLRALTVLEESAEYDLMVRTWIKLGLVYHLVGDYNLSNESYGRAFVLRRQLRSGFRPTDKWSSRPLQTAMLDPVNPDPGRDTGRDAWLIDQLFSGLVTLSADLDVIPDLAKSWHVSADGRNYTFRLRDDVMWSDGEPVQAEDFAFAWRRVLEPTSNSPYAGLLYGIKGARACHEGSESDPAGLGVRAVDVRTLEVELEQANRNFLYVAAHRVTSPVPTHVIKRNGASWTDPITLVGNGPFLLESWKPGEQIHLLRNPAYHRQYRGNAERVHVSLLDSWSGQVSLFEGDELDIVAAHSLPSNETLRLTQNQKLRETWASDLRVSYVAFDTRHPPFDDLRVRQVFAFATDRVQLARFLLDQYNLPATGGFLPPGLAGHTPDLALEYDLERARELLTEAGYPEGKGIPVLQCVESKTTSIWRSASALLREQWQRNLGVTVHTRALSRNEIVEQQYSNQPPHICLLGWRADYPDADNFLRLAPIEMQTGWRSPDYDRYVQEACISLDRDRRLELYQLADSLLMQEVPILPLTYHRWQVLLKPWVREHPVSTMGFWDWKDVILAE